MATNRKIKQVQFDSCSAVSPHLRIDTWLTIFQSFGKHFVNPPLFRIVEVEFRDRFRIEERHSGVVAANHGVVLERPFEVRQQRLDDEEAPRQDVEQRASARSPTATGKVVLLPINGQVITELAGDDLGSNAGVVFVALDDSGWPLRRTDAALGLIGADVFWMLRDSDLENRPFKLQRFGFVPHRFGQQRSLAVGLAILFFICDIGRHFVAR